MYTEKIRYGDSVLAGMSHSGAPLSLPGALAPIAPRWLRPWTRVSQCDAPVEGSREWRDVAADRTVFRRESPHGGETGVRLYGWPTLLHDPNENNSVQATLLLSV